MSVDVASPLFIWYPLIPGQTEVVQEIANYSYKLSNT